MAINKTALDIIGVTEKQYETWCAKNNRALNSRASKTEFFKRIREGRLAVDFNDNLVVKKRRK